MPFLGSKENFQLPPEEENFYYATQLGFSTIRSKKGTSNNTHLSVGQNISKNKAEVLAQEKLPAS